MLALLERLITLQPQRTAKLLKVLPSSWQQYQRMHALKRSLRLVASRSKFYRERFFLRDMDINRIQSPADLGDLFTTADDLLNTPSDAFLCAPPQLAFETAGTSGKNKKL